MSDDVFPVNENENDDFDIFFGRLNGLDNRKLFISLLIPFCIKELSSKFSNLKLEEEIESQVDIYNLISEFIKERKIQSFDNFLIYLKTKDSSVPIVFGFDKFCTNSEEYLTTYSTIFSSIIARYIMNDPILVFKIILSLFISIPNALYNLNLLNDENYTQLSDEFNDFFTKKISPFVLKKIDYMNLLNAFINNKEHIKRENNISEEDFQKNPAFEILSNVISIKDILLVLKDNPKLKSEFLNGLQQYPDMYSSVDIDNYISNFKKKHNLK